jgi:lathosterol oxidase
MDLTLSEILFKITRNFSLGTARYLLFAGLVYLFFYVLRKKQWSGRKIQSKPVTGGDVRREIKYSLMSMMIFALLSVGTLALKKAGFTKVYTDFSEHSFGYFIFSVVLFILAHDTYFYWSHRLMHWKPLYKYVHKVHHLSVNPTPWAAFAFHPLEALIEFGIVPIMLLTIPVHPLAILIWIIYQSLNNVMGHSGYEVFNKGFTRNVFTFWMNTPTHHNMHHRYVNCNYGLYFNIWDRLMGTNHAAYHDKFEEIVGQAVEEPHESLNANSIPS